jgi:hypothetical protein
MVILRSASPQGNLPDSWTIVVGWSKTKAALLPFGFPFEDQESVAHLR